MFSTSYQPPQFVNLNQPPPPEPKKEMSKSKPISEPYAFGYLPPSVEDDVVVEEPLEESEEEIDYGDEEPVLTEEGNIVFDEDVDEEEEDEKLQTVEDKTHVYLFLEDYSNRENSLLPFVAMLNPVEQWNIIKKALFTGFTKVDGLEKVADKYIKLVADAILINRDQIEDHPTSYYFLSYAKSRGLV
ncbi:hypothetical protein LCDVSa026R [Lymphocystis disease virus 3]|uniref:Uncharacterized protein n=1 Tax=Lymphocystis disease virus 3 TaxID=2560566 RepID=A0A1B2RVT7_9VIRU|nr:hypothetical protein BZK12_gp026 [Lymphocystis disease virus Sa]AOC55110.1 hypothetical protein LCDVSa026R [Lymphocystis disease virus 3]